MATRAAEPYAALNGTLARKALRLRAKKLVAGSRTGRRSQSLEIPLPS
jgi:hypothetical protein